MTSTPASRSARATSFTPRSCPSSPTFPINTRKGFAATVMSLLLAAGNEKRGWRRAGPGRSAARLACPWRSASTSGWLGDRTRSSCLYLFKVIFPFYILFHVPHLNLRIVLEDQQPFLLERPVQNPSLRFQRLQGIQIVAHDIWQRQVRHGRDEIAEVERRLVFGLNLHRLMVGGMSARHHYRDSGESLGVPFQVLPEIHVRDRRKVLFQIARPRPLVGTDGVFVLAALHEILGLWERGHDLAVLPVRVAATMIEVQVRVDDHVDVFDRQPRLFQ